MLCSDPLILTTFSLAASRLPASDLPQAFRGLAVALVPASWLVLAAASFAKASPRARSPSLWADGCVCVYRGGCPRELQLPREKLGENVATFSSGVLETRKRRLPTSLSSSREQDRETNSLIGALGTRTLSAARQLNVFSGTRRRDKRTYSSCGEREPRRRSPIERLLGNKTERQTDSFVVRGTRTLSAARRTIESAAESEIGPRYLLAGFFAGRSKGAGDRADLPHFRRPLLCCGSGVARLTQNGAARGEPFHEPGWKGSRPASCRRSGRD